MPRHVTCSATRRTRPLVTAARAAAQLGVIDPAARRLVLRAAAATAERAAAAVEAEEGFEAGGGDGEGDATAVNPELRDRLQREL